MVISGNEGVYLGEWQTVDKLDQPTGRGILDCEDKWILGYTEKGEWILGSQQIVILKKKNEFRVFRV